MSRSKYSPQQGKENKTVPGEEEQSSQTSSWWLLVLIALCTVTTIVDKRRRHPSTAPTELQDKQTKRGQIESSASDNGQGRNKWNPQTWGNFSLVLIQGALFSLFQIVGPSGSWEDKEGGVYSCLLIALVGFVIFCFTTTMSASGVVITGMMFLLLTVFGTYSSQQKVATGWIIFFQISILVVAWKASESLKGPNQKWIE
ncbi:hypothetical protein [Corynebacterium kefirresidentii]|uniref:hypothetical protein n=1 Tax=Corynebacterium kefirresidentii TaxID=1979527 RepID=UPI001177B838|nr:hypothetical protein [Corynebacterium kefirresidentii]